MNKQIEQGVASQQYCFHLISPYQMTSLSLKYTINGSIQTLPRKATNRACSRTRNVSIVDIDYGRFVRWSFRSKSFSSKSFRSMSFRSKSLRQSCFHYVKVVLFHKKVVQFHAIVNSFHINTNSFTNFKLITCNLEEQRGILLRIFCKFQFDTRNRWYAPASVCRSRIAKEKKQ